MSGFAHARGALVILNDVPAAGVAEYERWNTAEHLPERLGVAGFLRGRRFAACDGRPSYLTLYDTLDVDVLRSPAYLARLNAPTPRSVREFGNMLNPSRTAASVRVRRGQGSGAVVGVWQISAQDARRPGLMAWLSGAALDIAFAVEGVVSALLLEGNAEVTGIDTAEKGTRPGLDAVCDLVLLVEGHSLAAVGEACQRMSPLQAHGASAGDRLGFYAVQVECLPAAARSKDS